MQRFTGTKHVNAMPMTRQDYNDFRGWEMPDDEVGSDDGYLVEDAEGGIANTKEYDGYISWSPKAVFERSYNPSEKPLERMLIEGMELIGRLKPLSNLLKGKKPDQISDKQWALLQKQFKKMDEYHDILNERIEDLATADYPG